MENETPKYEVEALRAADRGMLIPEYPVISESERLEVRNAQFNRTNTREQANVAVKNADQKLGDVINGLAKKYEIDPKSTDFNMVTLEFVPKK